MCVRHYMKLTAVVLSQEKPPYRVGRAHYCLHLRCSWVLHWLGPGWGSALSTTGAVLATGAVQGDQEVQRTLVLLGMPQQLCPEIFAVLTLLLCSAKGEEKSTCSLHCSPANAVAH